ncbi:MAG: hypothetical protein JW774_08445 [Candidatus Aureabacteria bacterium]|nr:hypothetical protein [Candidatus Auribacterota bacterium]
MNNNQRIENTELRIVKERLRRFVLDDKIIRLIRNAAKNGPNGVPLRMEAAGRDHSRS